MTLYHVDWCPECAVVQRKLDDLGLAYEARMVPDFRPMRKEVFDVSGQYYVPVLKDGETVLTETHAILAYLDACCADGNDQGAREGVRGKRKDG